MQSNYISSINYSLNIVIEGLSLNEVRGVYAHFTSEVSDNEEGVRTLKKILHKLSEIGVNMILPLAKDTSSRVSYTSKVLPRFFKNVDIIKEVTNTCKDLGVEVHPWVCVFVEKSLETSPILSKHPNWVFVSSTGEVREAICPSNREARKFLLSVMEELIVNYDINGVSLDYVRTPGGLCYCKNCVREFEKESGCDPRTLKPGSEKWYEWEEWQRENISTFVKEAHTLTKQYSVKLSSYVWTSTSRYIVAQDWPAWVRKGYLDFIIPTGYVYSIDVFRKLCQEAKIVVRDIIPTYMCIGIRTSHGFLERPADVLTYIDVVRRIKLQGYVFFSLSSLLPMVPYLKEALE